MTVKKCSRLCLNPLVLNLQKYRSFSLHFCPQHTKGLRMLPMDSRSNSALVFRFHFALSRYTIRGKSGSLLPCLARNSAPAAIFISHDKSCSVQNIDRMFNIHLKLVNWTFCSDNEMYLSRLPEVEASFAASLRKSACSFSVKLSEVRDVCKLIFWTRRFNRVYWWLWIFRFSLFDLGETFSVLFSCVQPGQSPDRFSPCLSSNHTGQTRLPAMTLRGPIMKSCRGVR